MNITTAFAAAVRTNARKSALFWGDREYSYGQLWQEAQSVAARLEEHYQVKKGDRVGVWLKNCPEFIPILMGVLRVGAVVVPINNFLKIDEVGFMLRDAGIEVLVTDDELGSHFRALASLRPNLKLFAIQEMDHRHGSASGPFGVSSSVNRSDLAMLIYTSGTTGRPKGAMLSHGNLLHNVESCRLVLDVVPEDRLVLLLPMFHSYMLTVGILLPLLVGASIVLVKSVHPVRNVLQEIVQRRATLLPAIPQFYRSMVGAGAPGPLPLRACVSGAAPLPAPVLEAFEAKFQIPLIEGYGLSEASPVVTKNPLHGRRKPGSIGVPIPHVEVSVQDESGRRLGPEEIGEICVRGGNVMLGYWRQPAETSKAIRDGWLLTGDIGRRDAEGYFYITDRKKDMLLVNGINVYPREIEDVLYDFPGVKEAAVIGKPDPRRGEQPLAFVAADEGVPLEEEAVRRFVRHRLADYKVPRRVIFLPTLPRNATGKILKTALRALEISL
jgi:long-chain acyl-CoA synthetase